MLPVLQATLPVFAIIVLGFGLRKSGFIAAEKWSAVEDLCFYVLFPEILAKTMIEADLSNIEAGAFTLTIVLAWPLLAVRFWRFGHFYARP